MPQMSGRRGGSGSMGGNGPMGGNSGRSSMGGPAMGGNSGHGSMGGHGSQPGMNRQPEHTTRRESPMGGRNEGFGRGAEPRMGGMEPHMDRPRNMEPRKPMRYGADPRHAAPFGLILADVIWNRAHFNRIRKVLEKMTWNMPITPIEERILWESFGRRIEYYEAAELLTWVDRELSYL